MFKKHKKKIFLFFWDAKSRGRGVRRYVSHYFVHDDKSDKKSKI